MGKRRLNFYPWLQDEEYADGCKKRLSLLYDDYFYCKDEIEKQEILKQLEIYLAVVCDIVAYRNLAKHYKNQFFKLGITIEEYIEYKTQRLLVTIRDKKEYISDICGYVYISFMYSCSKLIYDYAEKIGHCSLIKENLPYYQVMRNKFFGVAKKAEDEHYIYNVESLCLDDDGENQELIKSNLDNYSYSLWEKKEQSEFAGVDQLLCISNIIDNTDCSQNAKDYLKYLFKNWDILESGYQKTKQKFGDNNYSLQDYIVYLYSNGNLNLTDNEFQDVLKLFKNILTNGKEI